MANRGFPRTSNQIKEAVKSYLDMKGAKKFSNGKNKPGNTWFYGFLRRHPRIVMAKAEPLEKERAMACSKEAIDKWFADFSQFLADNNITSADQIYNCDETGFPLQPDSKQRVCTDRFSRRNFRLSSSSKMSITSLQCICANGKVLPPAIIFPGKKFNPEYAIGFPENYYIGFTKNGWIDSTHFYGWLTNHFVKNIPPLRPVVLLMDGHSSHINYHVTSFCDKDEVKPYRLQQHSSQGTQPTDDRFFGNFKINYGNEVTKWTNDHPEIPFSKRTFVHVFVPAFDSVKNRADTVINSFKHTGIWPVNRNAIPAYIFKPAETFVSNDVSDSPLSILAEAATASSILSFSRNSTADQEESASASTSVIAPSCSDVDFTAQKVLPGSSNVNTINQPSSASSLLSSPISIQDSRGILTPHITLPGAAVTHSTPKPPSSSDHPTYKALRALEDAIGTMKVAVFKCRYLEKLHFDDPTYNSWKILYSDWEEIKENIRLERIDRQCKLNADLDPILENVLRLPEVERKPKKKDKVDIPKDMTCASAMKLLKAQEEEKRRKELVKLANRLKREEKKNLKAAKSKVTKKTPKVPKAPVTHDEPPSTSLDNEECIPKPRSKRARKPRKFEDYVSEPSSSEAEAESEEYWECYTCVSPWEEGELWVRCDECDKKYHASCTELRGKRESYIESIDWCCQHCDE